jgi:hypothetical protein
LDLVAVMLMHLDLEDAVQQLVYVGTAQAAQTDVFAHKVAVQDVALAEQMVAAVATAVLEHLVIAEQIMV